MVVGGEACGGGGEAAAEVVQVDGIGWIGKDLIDEREEVVEGADGGQR